MELEYRVVGDYSVITGVSELKQSLGNCFEPSPSKSPVAVFGEEQPNIQGLREGAAYYWYPDHVEELRSLLGIEIPEPTLPAVGSGPPGVIETPVRVVPETVTATQVRLWLFRRGVSLADVQAAIESIPDQQTRGEAMIQWEYAPYIERSHPLIAAIAASLGLSDIDEAFYEASLL